MTKPAFKSLRMISGLLFLHAEQRRSVFLPEGEAALGFNPRFRASLSAPPFPLLQIFINSQLRFTHFLSVIKRKLDRAGSRELLGRFSSFILDFCICAGIQQQLHGIRLRVQRSDVERGVEDEVGDFLQKFYAERAIFS